VVWEGRTGNRIPYPDLSTVWATIIRISTEIGLCQSIDGERTEP
jgi:hypothetical protein